MTTPPIDQMKCAQNIPPEVFKQGHAMYYACVRSGDGEHMTRDELIAYVAQLLADFHGYSTPGARFTFEVNIQASIRVWLRGASRYEPSVTE